MPVRSSRPGRAGWCRRPGWRWPLPGWCCSWLATQSTTLAAYDSPLGTAILLIGGAVCAVAYRLMLRIGRLPDDVRVLQ